MRQALVIGNWKMHGSVSDITGLLQALTAGVDDDLVGVDCAVCPPYVYLPHCAQLLKNSALGLGAQNCATELKGAFTGEVAAAMLAEFDCQYVLLGHSERRSLYAETDALVSIKVAQAIDSDLHPVVCVGESLQQREAGSTLAVVEEQLDAVLNAYSVSQLDKLVVAYEPVWAIGTGLTASPEQAQEVHAALRLKLAGKDKALGEETRILYGGSVNAANAEELFGQADIDGGLIGGASLKPDDFLAICRAGAA